MDQMTVCLLVIVMDVEYKYVIITKQKIELGVGPHRECILTNNNDKRRKYTNNNH